MPKEARRRSYGHDPAPRPSKRQFAVTESAEHVVIGEKKDEDARDILSSITAEAQASEVRPTLTKKEKQQLKHDALINRLGASHSPYSKSHNRRLKRKAKEQLSTGLTELVSALDAVVDGESSGATTEEVVDEKGRPTATRTSVIAEGKANPLSKHQRKQILKTERLRQKLLQNTPEFTSNPFQAVRMHAQNTLAKHTTAS
ncbi:hypothetical protein SCHPADRAFT_864196 [Schizopora paradoxa]|uniref:Ribosome biogenesis protein SLX9 n=1 Tax=Schizopora paradoxa TaxID=27342 RepID=A0A0H2SSY3_9AGAM|nr:hypothetical protein SCHPADRAFT_864196 [Schizopora paradoxa]